MWKLGQLGIISRTTYDYLTCWQCDRLTLCRQPSFLGMWISGDHLADGQLGNLKICGITKTHNVFTHFRKDLDCPVCRTCKIKRAQCQTAVSRQEDAFLEPLAFAERLSADHAFLGEDDKSGEKD